VSRLLSFVVELNRLAVVNTLSAFRLRPLLLLRFLLRATIPRGVVGFTPILRSRLVVQRKE